VVDGAAHRPPALGSYWFFSNQIATKTVPKKREAAFSRKKSFFIKETSLLSGFDWDTAARAFRPGFSLNEASG